MNKVKAVIVGMASADTRFSLDAELKELEALCDTLDIEVVKTFTQIRAKKDPGMCIGAGKAEEIIQYLQEHTEVECVVFDDLLTPSQGRKLEEIFNPVRDESGQQKVFVVDRPELILDIFARRAQTHEGKLQVELARNIYFLPRLKRMWTHLHRQKGGARGTKGEGEMQIEIDRRTLKKRITFLKEELKKVKQIRATQRKRRESYPVPVVSIVGYTNAGKSTLLNSLTDSDVFVEDKLFATLDPSVRKYRLDNGLDILLVDTVGFIRKIPHMLIEAFNATLEEITRSELILVVMDGSDEEVFTHLDATEKVLIELKADSIPRINVINKSDILHEEGRKNLIKSRISEPVFISAREKLNFDSLSGAMSSFFKQKMVNTKLEIPYSEFSVYNQLKECGSIILEQKTDTGIFVEANIFYRHAFLFQKYSRETAPANPELEQ